MLREVHTQETRNISHKFSYNILSENYFKSISCSVLKSIDLIFDITNILLLSPLSSLFSHALFHHHAESVRDTHDDAIEFYYRLIVARLSSRGKYI